MDDDNVFYIQQLREVVALEAVPDGVILAAEEPHVHLDVNQARSLYIQLGMAIDRSEGLEWFENADGEMEIVKKEDRQ